MWLKFISIFLISLYVHYVHSSVPTEEGLLKNLNNNEVQAKFVILKMLSTEEDSPEKSRYIKFIFSLENPSQISFLQMAYNGSQMLPGQLNSVKYFPSLSGQIKRESIVKKNMFYATLAMLLLNRPEPMEAFLEKGGVKIGQGSGLINEEKLNLLKAYKQFLITSPKGGEENSPLNPQDPKQKENVINLFRSNTYKRSENITLVRLEGEYLWQADWKTKMAYFSNEERQLRIFIDRSENQETRMEFNNYLLFNGINEFPKSISVEDSQGKKIKMQVLGIESRLKLEKSLEEIYKESKISNAPEEGALPALLY